MEFNQCYTISARSACFKSDFLTISREFSKVKRNIDNNYDLCSRQLFVGRRFKTPGEFSFDFWISLYRNNLYVNEETLSNTSGLGERFSSRSLFAKDAKWLLNWRFILKMIYWWKIVGRSTRNLRSQQRSFDHSWQEVSFMNCFGKFERRFSSKEWKN